MTSEWNNCCFVVQGDVRHLGNTKVSQKGTQDVLQAEGGDEIDVGNKNCVIFEHTC